MPKIVGGSLDTNLVLRVLVNDVPEQTKAVKQLIERGYTFAIEDVCIIETTFVLMRYYEMPRKEIRRVLFAFFENARLVIERDTFGEVLELFETHPALSIEDCYLAVKAKNNAYLPLWTFDKKLSKQISELTKLIDQK